MAEEHAPIYVLEERVKNLKEDIARQAYEYERRLTELNHAHARAAEDKNKFLTTELFYAKFDEINKWSSEMDSWRAKVVGIAVGVGAVSGGAVGLILNMLK